DALEAQDFDLVLMDLNMPVMGGLEATKLYRVSAMGQRRVPIIALTADATPETRQLCAEAGMDAYLTKPVEPSRLLASIETVTSGMSSPDSAGTAGVADISTHPRFRAGAGGPPLDEATLDGLEALGGAQFLAELAHDFLEDAEEHLVQLDIAISERDVVAFRATVHAIRSGAANLGAQAVFDLCSFAEHLPASDIQRQGRAYLIRISAELDRAREALVRRSGPTDPEPRGRARG
ncbi:MAG TPA: response regulator, partial [Roseomonas sp.]